MGANVMDILANNPLRAQQTANQTALTNAQIPGIQAQGQQAQLQAQMMQQQLQDQRVLSQAWQSSDGDWDAFTKAAKQGGLSWGGYAGLMNDHITMQKNLANLTEAQNAAMKPMLDQKGQLYESIKDAGPEGSQARLNAAQQVGQHLGEDPSQLLTDQQLNTKMAGVNYLASSIDNNLKAQQANTQQSEQGKNQAAAAKDVADAQKTQAEIPGVQAQGQMTQAAADSQMLAQAAKQGPQALQAALGNLPYSRAKMFEGLSNPADIVRAGLTPEQNATTTFNQQKLAFDQNAKTFEEKLAAQKNAREQQQFNMTYGQGLNEFGQPINGGQQGQQPNPLAHAIAMYQVPPPSPRSLQTPMGQMLFRQILAENPDFDATQYPNRQKTRQAFTTGSQGQQINAMNTAIGHLDQLGDAVSALNNGNIQIANRAKNWLGTQFGSASATNFDTLKTALSGELASVLKKTGATDAEIKSVESTISSKNSPEQLAGYVKTQIPIMGSKLNALNYQYHQAMGANDPFQALSPEAKSVLQKNGFDPNNPRIQQGAQTAGAKPIVQHSPSTGQYRYSVDGGKTWQPGQPQ